MKTLSTFKEKSDFSFFVPIESEGLEKAAKKTKKSGRYDNMVIEGIASDSSIDSDEEVLEPKGFELERFMSMGWVNYEHRLRDDTKYIIGEPLEAKIVDNKFYIKAKLFKERELARNLYDTMIMLKEVGSKKKIGWSIEGKAITRDVRNPKIVKKALITGIAITAQPKNSNSYADIVKGGYSNPLPNYEYETEDGNVEKSIQSTNGRITYLVDITDKDKGIRYTIDKDLNLKVEKAMSTTTAQPLIKESLEGDKKKKRAILNLANAAMVGDISKSLFNKTKNLFVVNKAIEGGLIDEDINVLIKAKISLQAKNPNSRWVTINGAKVLIGSGGNVIAGAGGRLGGGEKGKGGKKNLSSVIKEAAKIGGSKPVNERTNKEINEARELIENTMPKSKGEMTWNEYKPYGVAIQKQSSHSQPESFYERGAKMEHEWALKNKEKSKSQFDEGRKEVKKDNRLSLKAEGYYNRSKAEFDKMSPKEKEKAILQVKSQLELNKQGEKVGFGLDKDMVAAGEKFLKEVGGAQKKKEIPKAVTKKVSEMKDLNNEAKKLERVESLYDSKTYEIKYDVLKNMSGIAKKIDSKKLSTKTREKLESLLDGMDSLIKIYGGDKKLNEDFKNKFGNKDLSGKLGIISDRLKYEDKTKEKEGLTDSKFEKKYGELLFVEDYLDDAKNLIVGMSKEYVKKETTEVLQHKLF